MHRRIGIVPIFATCALLMAACSGETPKATTTRIASPATTVTQVPNALQSESGSGSDSLLPFTVPSGDKGWKLNWTYNCSNVGKRSQFQVYIIQEAQTSERSTQLNIKDFPVSVFGDSGSSTSHFQGTGTFNLDVNSECRWTVAVVGVA